MAELNTTCVLGDMTVTGNIYASGYMIDVTDYTSYDEISKVVESGAIPIYKDNSNLNRIFLYSGIQTVDAGNRHTFTCIRDRNVYFISFLSGSTSFSSISSKNLLPADTVVPSTVTIEWQTDDERIPTRKAVQDKIVELSAGFNNGASSFMGYYTVAGMNSLIEDYDYIFKPGDWFTIVGQSGTLSYYPQNDRTQTKVSLSLQEDDDVYWCYVAGQFAYRRVNNILRRFSTGSVSNWNNLSNTRVYEIASRASPLTKDPESGEYGLGPISCITTNPSSDQVTQLAAGTELSYRTGSTLSSANWERVYDTDVMAAYIAHNYFNHNDTNIPAHNVDVWNGYHISRTLPSTDSALLSNTLYLV